MILDCYRILYSNTYYVVQNRAQEATSAAAIAELQQALTTKDAELQAKVCWDLLRAGNV